MVRDLVRNFSLEVLAGEDQLHREITRQRTHRPGLEFIGYFDFFPMNRIQILGQKEINYLHKLSREERRERIGNIVTYRPPCFIVTHEQEGLRYLTEHCDEEGIPLLRTSDVTYEFITKLNNYLAKMLAPEQ